MGGREGTVPRGAGGRRGGHRPPRSALRGGRVATAGVETRVPEMRAGARRVRGTLCDAGTAARGSTSRSPRDPWRVRCLQGGWRGRAVREQKAQGCPRSTSLRRNQAGAQGALHRAGAGVPGAPLTSGGALLALRGCCWGEFRKPPHPACASGPGCSSTQRPGQLLGFPGLLALRSLGQCAPRHADGRRVPASQPWPPSRKPRQADQ